MLPVTDVDRGLTDPPNLDCSILDIDFKTNMHELACEAGVLGTMYAHYFFDLYDGGTYLSVNVKLSNKLRVR